MTEHGYDKGLSSMLDDKASEQDIQSAMARHVAEMYATLPSESSR